MPRIQGQKARGQTEGLALSPASTWGNGPAGATAVPDTSSGFPLLYVPFFFFFLAIHSLLISVLATGTI